MQGLIFLWRRLSVSALHRLNHNALRQIIKRWLFGLDGSLCRKVKTRGFLRNIPLSSFSFLCNEEICSISSNFTTALLFRPSAVKVALTSAVPVKLTYQSKVVSDVGVTLYTN